MCEHACVGVRACVCEHVCVCVLVCASMRVRLIPAHQSPSPAGSPKDSVRVLAREDIWLQRKVREAIEIKIRQPAMYRDQGYELPPTTTNYCRHVIVVKAVT